MPALGRAYFMVEGVDTSSLRKGPGHFPDTPLPGERGTVAVAGHRTTYLAPFRTIDKLERGDRVIASMPYGRFVYRVERTRIVEPAALCVKRRREVTIAGALRRHPTVPAGPGRPSLVEFEYRRGGALAHIAAWDVHHANPFDRVEEKTGIVPFGRLSTRS